MQENPKIYADGRPTCELRLPATDQGVVLFHGDGPDGCDVRGAREAVVYLEDGIYHLFYDGAGAVGWRACLATSRDLVQWQKRGALLEIGAPDAPDCIAAISPWVIHDGTRWHMFYIGTTEVSAAPDLIPSPPYLTFKATAPRLAGPWTKHYEVRPFDVCPGTWYEMGASAGYIIYDGGEYLQYFSAALLSETGNLKRTLGLARTRDLNGAWQIDPEPLFSSEEQIENSSLYFEPENGLWFLFTNHIAADATPEGGIAEYTDAIWVYWSKDPRRWNPRDKAIVLDKANCSWAKGAIGMPAVIPRDGRLALLYDGLRGDGTTHLHRDIGLAWLDLPLRPPV